MTLDEFVATYSGESTSFDGVRANTGQCLQLVSYYNKAVIGAPPFFTPAAKDWFERFNNSLLTTYYERIAYSPGVFPKVGDIVVWGASDAIHSPVYGHIDVCIKDGTSKGFTGFDSNWGSFNSADGYPAAHTVVHDYTAVLGYLRPISPQEGENMIETEDQAAEIIRAVFDREPTEGEIKDLIGRNWYDAIRLYRTSKAGESVHAQVVDFPMLQQQVSALQQEIQNSSSSTKLQALINDLQTELDKYK